MTVVDCEQYTDEWWAARVGVFTASTAADMMAQPRKGSTESIGRMELRVRLALERLTGESADDDPYTSKWMERGKLLQDEGAAVFEATSGELIQEVGFIRHDELLIGCSPDGLIGDGGFEIKCPKLSTHWNYLNLGGKVPAEYVPQVLHSLLVTDLPFWIFASYHPKFTADTRLYQVRVRREDVDLAAYELAVRLFLDDVEKTVEQLRALGKVLTFPPENWREVVAAGSTGHAE